MRIPLALAIAVGVSSLGQPGAAQDRATPQTVQIDLNKLPPDVAKRLLDELAKQASPAVAAAAGKKPKEDEREKEMRRGKRKPGDAQGREKEKENENKEKEAEKRTR